MTDQYYYKSIHPVTDDMEVILLHNVYSDSDANVIFNNLDSLPWNTTLSDKSVKPKHDTYFYGPESYKYSGVEHLKNDTFPPFIQSLFSKVNSLGDFNFNSILINRYTNGSGVAPHRDDETYLDNNHDILTLRFGKTRPIDFLNNRKEIIRTYQIENGSGYIMPIGFQDVCLHQVKSDIKETTISLTFRKMAMSTGPKANFSSELGRAKDLTSVTDTLLSISEKLKSIEGNPTFEAIKPSLLKQFGVIINDLFLKINEKMNVVNETIQKNSQKVQNENIKLSNKINDLESELENQRMYSNRNNLLLMGIKENKNEDTDTIISDIMLKCNINLAIHNIKRAHRLGNIKKIKDRDTGEMKDSCRPIIMKFLNYRERKTFIQGILKYNSEQSGPPSNFITIREHLTKSRLDLFQKFIELRFLKKVKSVYTSDGIINVKINANDERYLKIKNEAEFNELKYRYKF